MPEKPQIGYMHQIRRVNGPRLSQWEPVGNARRDMCTKFAACAHKKGPRLSQRVPLADHTQQVRGLCTQKGVTIGSMGPPKGLRSGQQVLLRNPL